jgi:TATA-binding protein-associated factor
LKELPPKVIQDYPCKMTPVQASTHSHVERNFPFQQVLSSITEKRQAGASILKNLIMHRKVCNHPALLNDELSKTVDVSWQQSGKLVGLVELLVESEILPASAVNGEGATEEPKSLSNDILGTIADVFGSAAQQAEPHRALIFCQMSSFMNLIISQVLEKFNVKHL